MSALPSEANWRAALYHHIVSQTDDPYWVIDPNTSVFLDANEASLKQLGYSRDELIGQIGVIDVNQSLDSLPAWRQAADGLALGQTFRYVADLQHKSGHLVSCEITLKRIAFAEREVFVAVTRDVSELVAVETALVQREHLMQGMLRTMSEGVLVCDENLICLYANTQIQQQLGADSCRVGAPFEWQDGIWFDRQGMPLAQSEFALMQAAHYAKQTRDQLLEIRRPDGYQRWLLVNADPIISPDHSDIVLTFTDVSELQHSRQQVRYISSVDPVCGLPNQKSFGDESQRILASPEASKHTAAILQLDLDGFQSKNDALGRARGDELLRQIGHRLRLCLPESHLIARMNADTFAILLFPLSAEQAQAQAELDRFIHLIREAMASPLQLDAHTLYLSVCIGVALCLPEHAHNLDTLLQHSELALHQAQNTGRNSIRTFEPNMLNSQTQAFDTEHAIIEGLLRNEFELYFQPQWRLSDQIIIGVEALMRWRHPKRGILSPAHFIDVAESSGLILQLGDIALRQACQAARLLSQHPVGRHIERISVNVSAIQFQQANFYDNLKQIVRQEGGRPKQLQLEVTESVLLSERDSMLQRTAQLRHDGYAVSLDDFGTGYSSLSYLKQLALDELKIDRSFVIDLSSSESDRIIVQTILAMSNALGFSVVAEGVETSMQADILKTLGCDHAQGYFLSKPLPLAELIDWLDTLRKQAH